MATALNPRVPLTHTDIMVETFTYGQFSRPLRPAWLSQLLTVTGIRPR